MQGQTFLCFVLSLQTLPLYEPPFSFRKFFDMHFFFIQVYLSMKLFMNMSIFESPFVSMNLTITSQYAFPLCFRLLVLCVWVDILVS